MPRSAALIEVEADRRWCHAREGEPKVVQQVRAEDMRLADNGIVRVNLSRADRSQISCLASKRDCVVLVEVVPPEDAVFRANHLIAPSDIFIERLRERKPIRHLPLAVVGVGRYFVANSTAPDRTCSSDLIARIGEPCSQDLNSGVGDPPRNLH